MLLRDIVIVAVALAMDALGVALSLGLNKRVNKNMKVAYLVSATFFQFFLFFIGGNTGYLFEKYITAIPNILGGIAIGIVGILMIKEGFGENNNENDIFKKYLPLILGISVSIDAMVVGFTAFNSFNIYSNMFIYSLIVGIITLLICLTGFYSCKLIRKSKFITRYADFFGGIILLLFSIKMIFFN